MSKNADHHYAAFASRYADPTQDYLSAFTALTRMNTLLEDLDKFKHLLDVTEPPEGRWMPWFGAEIVSYYAVGFVTCLEWHARSRVVDLLSFDRAVRIDEFRGQISDKLIVEMMTQNAPISYLIGASINVPNLDRYLSIIGRVFEHLDIRGSVVDWLTGEAKGALACWIQQWQIGQLEHLFEFRNSLVHEVGSNVVGHFNIRDSWGPDQAIETGRIVASVIQGIEGVITAFAPKSFPNRLSEEGWPISPLVPLSEEVNRLEEIADAEIRDGNWSFPTVIEDWRVAREAAQAHLEAQERFIERAEMLHWRYWDARMPLRLNALRSRIEFLKALLDNFSSAHLDNPDVELPATRRM